MSAVFLLGKLAAADVELQKAGDRLKFTAPAGAVTPDLLAAIRRHKADLLALLEPAPPANSSETTRSREAHAAPGLDAVLASKLVRCADCRNVHYRSRPPARGAGPAWSEWLECDHGLTVTERGLFKPSHYCAMFNRRLLARKGA